MRRAERAELTEIAIELLFTGAARWYEAECDAALEAGLWSAAHARRAGAALVALHADAQGTDRPLTARPTTAADHGRFTGPRPSFPHSRRPP